MVAHQVQSGQSGRVFDCFTFFDELEVLDIRLHELSDVVDCVVLVEGALTFTGKNKKLYYAENKHLFREFGDRIRHVVVDDFPQTDDPWTRERHQREAVARGFTDARPHDAILLSDCDEIPRRKDVAAQLSPIGVVGFPVQRFRYHLNRIGLRGIYEKGHPKMTLRMNYISARHLRRAPCKVGGIGWHFSFMGSPERVKYKLQSWSHQEHNRDQTVEYIRQQIASGGDAYKSLQWTPIPLDSSFPEHVLNNRHKFRHLIAQVK